MLDSVMCSRAQLGMRVSRAEEICAKQEKIQRFKLDVDEKDEEARRMIEEMAEAKRQLEVSLGGTRLPNLIQRHLI